MHLYMHGDEFTDPTRVGISAESAVNVRKG